MGVGVSSPRDGLGRLLKEVRALFWARVQLEVPDSEGLEPIRWLADISPFLLWLDGGGGLKVFAR